MKVSGGLSGFARRTASYAIVSHFIQINIHWHSGTLNTYKIDCLPFVCCSVLFYVYIVCTYACFVEPTMCSIAVSNTFFFGTHFFSRKDCWCSSNMPTITVEHITLSHFSCFFVLFVHSFNVENCVGNLLRTGKLIFGQIDIWQQQLNSRRLRPFK